MKLFTACLFLLICNSILPYQEIFREDFTDSALVMSIWKPSHQFSFTQGITGRGIQIKSSSSNSSVMISTAVNLYQYKGGMICLSAMIKADSISAPPKAWNGIKVMLKITLSNGSAIYPQLKLSSGSFGWTNRSLLVPVPENTVSWTLYLGIEKSSGTVTFDNVIIKLLRHPDEIPAERDKNIPIDKGHNYGALRGVNVSTSMTEKDAFDLGSVWKANLIRWQIGGTKYPLGLATPEYDKVLEAELQKLDRVLVWCGKYNLNVIVDLHSLAAGCFRSEHYQSKMISVWELIAARYRGNSRIWAYDLANEPSFSDGDWMNDSLLLWEELAEKITRLIRSIDPLKAVIIETPNGSVNTFDSFKPLDFSLTNIIYSVHMYEPFAFTHQTLYNLTQPYVYPGEINGKVWNKSILAAELLAAKRFQEKYRVPVMIGEFSAIRWAPSNSAYNYIQDCIELFESFNWDWCYHSFREWHGWSVEHREDQNDLNRSSQPTERQKLLTSYFQKNVTAVIDQNEFSVYEYKLEQNYPNPFNSSTVISFVIASAEFVKLTIYDILGKEAAILLDEQKDAGRYEMEFSAADLPSGIYLCRLKAGEFEQIRKIILLK